MALFSFSSQISHAINQWTAFYNLFIVEPFIFQRVKQANVSHREANTEHHTALDISVEVIWEYYDR